ncbi:TetR/AcrR family transcriptional regulator [Arthrobacter sp. efr-133-TYG-118]|uniref:TetR/AcrR family transcriptional regulator n=1 Tax=Arthrobacter sp. efr-133-TYG-118 TaxID=3040279 RepID=UPI0025506D37|nr:TetR/AcrR family transcriptional regulator [Arthrobacter sp. efr-133-TYG-118]
MAQPRPDRGEEQLTDRRVRLDAETIVDAVLQLARDEPQSRFTFKRLGEALGVDATAMYRHFRNRDAILRAALDRLFSMALSEGTSGDSPTGWRPRLERYLTSLVDVFIKYPSIGCEAFATDTFGQGELRTIEFVLSCLSDAGLSDDRLVHYYAALESYTLGHGSGIAQEVLAKPNSNGHEPWLQAVAVASVSGFPLIEEHRHRLLSLDSLNTFSAGLSAILDSAEREGTR